MAAIDKAGKVISAARMPLMKALRGHKEVSTTALLRWLIEITDLAGGSANCFACLEFVHSFGYESRSSMFSFGRSDGKTRAALESLEIPFMDVDPKLWKNFLLPNTIKSSKQPAIDYCHNRWPTLEKVCNLVELTDGVADAFCLADYARLVVHSSLLGPNSPPKKS